MKTQFLIVKPVRLVASAPNALLTPKLSKKTVNAAQSSRMLLAPNVMHVPPADRLFASVDDVLHPFANGFAVFEPSQVGRDRLDQIALHAQLAMVNRDAHLRALPDQFFNEVGANEAGASGNQNRLVLVKHGDRFPAGFHQQTRRAV